MDRSSHWERVHTTKEPDEVSWHQEVPAVSLELIRSCAVALDTPLLDVGGGSAALVDHLIAEGFTDVTVLDVSEAALERARARLGRRGSGASWICCDVTSFAPERAYGLWHDRAAFHFLTDPADRGAYRRAAEAGVAPGGWVVMGTFARHGPERCSGLPVQRHDGASIAAALGPGFELVDERVVDHTTPGGAVQPFTFARLRRIRSGST